MGSDRHPGMPGLFMTRCADDAVTHSVQEPPRRGILITPFRPAQLVTRARELLDETDGMP